MADLRETLNILGMHTAVSDRPSYVEDPEEVLERRQYEEYLKVLPALEATERRASATIGPKETGPIEDVMSAVYSSKVGPIIAALDDITPGIPFYDIIPDPPDELPDGGNRMRNALVAIAMAEASPAVKKLGVGIYKRAKSARESLKYSKGTPAANRILMALDPFSPVNLFDFKRAPVQTLKSTLGHKILQAQRKVAEANPLSETFKIKPDSKWIKVSKSIPEEGWKGGSKSLDPKLEKQGWQLHWDEDGQAYVTRLTKRGGKAVDKARHELFNALSSKEEWNKFRKTYDDLINPAQHDVYINIPRTYKQYQAFLKDRLITNYHKHIGDVRLAPSTRLGSLIDEPSSAVGRFQGDLLGLEGQQAIAMATKNPKEYFKSVLKHELKHYLDFSVDRHKGKVYENMSGMYQGMMKDDVFQALGHWKMRQSIALKKYKSANPDWKKAGVPVDLVPVNPSLKRALYLSEPTEVSARIAQLKSKSNIEKLQEVLGTSHYTKLHSAERDLLEIFDPKTVERLKKTVWGAAPLMLDDEMYKDLK